MVWLVERVLGCRGWGGEVCVWGGGVGGVRVLVPTARIFFLSNFCP